MNLDILVVDDNPDICLMVGTMLELFGHECHVASGGQAALTLLGSQPRPDLVLLDVQMPDMDGWDVLEAIRRDAVLHDLPVVLCTVKSADADRERGERLGCDGYITKPFDIAELRDLIERVAALARRG